MDRHRYSAYWFNASIAFCTLSGVILSGLDGVLYPDINSSIDSDAWMAVGFVFWAVLLRSFGVVMDQVTSSIRYGQQSAHFV